MPASISSSVFGGPETFSEPKTSFDRVGLKLGTASCNTPSLASTSSSLTSCAPALAESFASITLIVLPLVPRFDNERRHRSREVNRELSLHRGHRRRDFQ